MNAAQDLAGKVAVVTGGGRGFGRAIAERLAAEGAAVALLSRSLPQLDDVAQAIRGKGGNAIGVRCDVTDAVSIDHAIAKVGEVLGPVDLLINNAGYGLRGDFAEQDRTQVLGMVDLNCRSLVALAHGVLPRMVERRSGAILNLASTAACQPGPWMAVYYATKAFVLSFSEALHEEVLDRGVRVTALCPGPTQTEFIERAGMKESLLFTLSKSSAKKVAQVGYQAMQRGEATVIPGLHNWALAQTVRFTPRKVVRSLASMLVK